MTAIEFIDRTPIVSIISSLTIVPDKIIFIGDDEVIRKNMPIYEQFILNRKLDIILDHRVIDRNNLQNIVGVLSELVETHKDCVFDLTGGEDLALVAMGIVYEKYKDKYDLQLQRFNMNSGVLTDCDSDGNIIFRGNPSVTVDELMQIHGGSVRYESDADDRTYNWKITEDFMSLIDRLWDICRYNPGRWNSHFNVMGIMSEINTSDNPLEIVADLAEAKRVHKDKYDNDKKRKYRFPFDTDIIRDLCYAGAITAYSVSSDSVMYRFADEQTKRLLSTAGTVLELKVLVTAMRAKEKNGSKKYTECRNGVSIDWDGNYHSDDDNIKDTENEIDVILMKGMVPLFISCKNGTVDHEELYKLDTVARRFGGPYVRKILIATYLGSKSGDIRYFRQRAKDMGIKLITDVDKMSEPEFSKTIRNLI